MTLMTGTATWRTYLVPGFAWRPAAEMLELLGKRRFCPLSTDTDATHGWVPADRPLAPDAIDGNCLAGACVVVAMRTDRWRLPPAELNARCQVLAEEWMATWRGEHPNAKRKLGKPPRSIRDEIKRNVINAMRCERKPVMALVEVAIDTGNERVYIGANSEAAEDLCERTFGTPLELINPWRTALVEVTTDARVLTPAMLREAFRATEPENFARVCADGVATGFGRTEDNDVPELQLALGREFLTWCALGQADHPDFTVTPCHKLRLADEAQRGRIEVTAGEPVQRVAVTALAEGSTVASLRVYLAESTVTFAMDLDHAITMSKVGLPAVVAHERDERWQERIDLLTRAEGLVVRLLARFITVRLNRAKWSECCAAIHTEALRLTATRHAA
jgi:hypothetical protein